MIIELKQRITDFHIYLNIYTKSEYSHLFSPYSFPKIAQAHIRSRSPSPGSLRVRIRE